MHSAPIASRGPHPTAANIRESHQPQTCANAARPPASVLIVEDDPENRAILAQTVTRAGHRVDAVECGEAALDALGSGRFDLILLDISMPGIDGYEVLRRVRIDHPAARLPVIMISGLSERTHVLDALQGGANDYVLKPFDAAIVTARVETQLALKRSFDQIATPSAGRGGGHDELIRSHAELQAAYDVLKTDLEYAARIQQALLPVRMPDVPGFRIGWTYQPCAELAGDSLGVLRLDETHVALYLLDVSGHGVSAALLSVAVSRALQPVPGRPSLVQRRARNRRLEPTPPAVVAEELNRRFQLQPETHQYFTLVYGVLDTCTHVLRFVCAGHPGPVHVSAAGAPAYIEHRGIAVGLVPDPGYAECAVHLAPGDRLYLHSDGLHEARNARNEQFGPARVLDSLRTVSNAAPVTAGPAETPPEAALGRLVQTARAWSGRAFEDDVSAIAIERVE